MKKEEYRYLLQDVTFDEFDSVGIFLDGKLLCPGIDYKIKPKCSIYDSQELTFKKPLKKGSCLIVSAFNEYYYYLVSLNTEGELELQEFNIDASQLCEWKE
jgi:hypothetical protein